MPLAMNFMPLAIDPMPREPVAMDLMPLVGIRAVRLFMVFHRF